MRVLIAPDKFAGTLSAASAAAAMAEGWAQARPADEVVQLPIADGGEGTLDVLAASVPGTRRMPVTVADPVGRPVTASWLWLPDQRGVVEAAQACGLSRLEGGELDPEHASSWGVGEILLAATDAGASEIVMALGGTATVDGGAGMAAAYGIELMLAQGGRFTAGAVRPETVTGIRPAARPASSAITVAADVRAPLLGPQGAAAVFGPQKGASPAAVERLERALGHYADVVERDLEGGPWRQLPGAGAGGGLGFGLAALFDAPLISGAAVVCELLGLDEALERADLVVTGEGSLDAQSIQGKAPAYVLERARTHGIPVGAIAGRLADGVDALFDRTVELGPEGLERPTELVRDRARSLAKSLPATAVAERSTSSEISW